MRHYFILFTVLISLILYLSSCMFQEDVKDDQYASMATWQGSGPDKWASIWLVSRHIEPGLTVKILPEGTIDSRYTFFDVPEVPLNRDRDHSTYQKLQTEFSLNDMDVQFIGRIIHDIDIRLWQGHQEGFSQVVEEGFRQMQANAGRDFVHPDCYMEFFDNVAEASKINSAQRQNILPQNLLPDTACQGKALKTLLAGESLIAEIPIGDLLTSISTGTKVTFIDVREVDEYLEGHLPGAIHLTIRDTSEATTQMLHHDGLLVPYCVKDFRGYEMAKKLKKMGFDNVAILSPYGLKGWLHTGLPLSYGEEKVTPEAQLAFNECVNKSSKCAMKL